MLELPRGIVNKLTGSFLIQYDKPGTDEKQVVDIGLNMKNFKKQVHIPHYVRFIQPDSAAQTIYDDFNHNQHSRGARHVRKHWEYSVECVDIIKEYCDRFPEAIEAMNSRTNKAMHSLQDLYPDIPRNKKTEAIELLKIQLEWIETLPISKLQYVEMGFDALERDMIERLQE